jgi:hypothetical protein
MKIDKFDRALVQRQGAFLGLILRSVLLFQRQFAHNPHSSKLNI